MIPEGEFSTRYINFEFHFQQIIEEQGAIKTNQLFFLIIDETLHTKISPASLRD